MIYTKEKHTLGNVCIYLDQKALQNYYAESYYLYNLHVRYLLGNMKKFESYAKETRPDYFQSLITAFTQNAKNLAKIVQLLKDKITVDSFENLEVNPNDNTQTTLKDFHYLRRDWCFTKEGEKQLLKINDEIKKEINRINFKKGKSLFLGCGVGRLAVDFIDLFDKVYATDKSFSMIWHLQKLINGDSVDFYCPQIKNVLSLNNISQKYTATIPKDRLKNVDEKFECFVSDVLDLPIKTQSVNCVFSIYFTDVIALKLWFNQINNVIAENGLFVHFGPLDYFFSDEREMLTAEEFRKFFEERGYITLVDKVVDTSHLEDDNSISYKVYRNWFFIAQKQSLKPAEQNISDNSILRINKPVLYERRGVLKDGENELEVILDLPNGKYNEAGPVIEILKLIDGQNTCKDIFTKLKSKGFEFEETEIKDLLLSFLTQQILVIEK